MSNDGKFYIRKIIRSCRSLILISPKELVYRADMQAGDYVALIIKDVQKGKIDMTIIKVRKEELELLKATQKLERLTSTPFF